MTPGDRSLTLKQWQVLRRLTQRSWAQGELAAALSRKPQAVAKSLAVLEASGLVHAVQERGHAAPNAPARLWALTEKGREHAERHAEETEDTDPDQEDTDVQTFRIAPKQTFVAARVTGAEVPKLLDVLADGEAAVEASFVARLDGDGQTYVFVFDPRLGSRPTEILSAALSAIEVGHTAGAVGDVRAWPALVADARAARTASERARERVTGRAERPDTRP